MTVLNAVPEEAAEFDTEGGVGRSSGRQVVKFICGVVGSRECVPAVRAPVACVYIMALKRKGKR